MSGPLAEIVGQGGKGAIAKVGASILEKLVDKGIEFVKQTIEEYVANRPNLIHDSPDIRK